jgi:hypothetical protein
MESSEEEITKNSGRFGLENKTPQTSVKTEVLFFYFSFCVLFIDVLNL